jgi:thiamine kinase-like enzyme
VDFEHAGWRDRAVELADLVEHAQARNTPTASWAWFVGRFDLEEHERARYQAARRLFAFFWLTLLQPQPGRKPASLDLALQLRHTIALLRAC